MSCAVEKGACLCGLKTWHFILAVLMVVYMVAVLFIPVDFPAEAVGMPKWLGLLFSAAFIAANVLLAVGVVKCSEKCIAEANGEHALWLTRIRDLFVAGFGFAASFRFLYVILWVIYYT